MKRTAAYLVRYALEQLNISHTFGIPGVHNTEIYDELDKSDVIEPVLVTHEAYGAFMADAVSRSSDSTGTLVIVPAAGATHAASGIGEASLDGIAMLVISGGVREDSAFAYQLHDMDQHALMKPITKKTYKVSRHDQVVATIFEAYKLANEGEPGPVFIEIPVNLQLDKGEVGYLPRFIAPIPALAADNSEALTRAAQLLAQAKHPGIFLGWGAVDASVFSEKIAEMLNAPVATTLQGLSAFNAKHPLHTGMGFGPAAVPAAYHAFKNCDCLLAVGTRFAEIATGSFGVTVPSNLIHLDINPEVFSANYPAKVTLTGDASLLLAELEKALAKQTIKPKVTDIIGQIAQDKAAYTKQWLTHDSGDKVNPALFFQQLRASLHDDAYIIADDGNHTFLTAELMPCYQVKHFFSPTDFSCMGYATPAVIGTKLANPDSQVVGIIGDGAFLMSYTELFTAAARGIGAIFTVFSDGELAQISQAQATPYNKKTCSRLPELKIKAMVEATGCQYLSIDDNSQVSWGINQALALAKENIPVVLDVNIDYSKKTRFTRGIIKTNLKRMPLPTKARMISRALWRRV